MDEWLFRKGHDTSWAKNKIDSTGWTKIRPSELSEKLADKNGKLEGWLRIKMRLDTIFRDTALDLYMHVWAASEVYVDGKLLHSFGNTGLNGKPFEEYNPTYTIPVSLNVQKHSEHVIAVHFVDFVSPLPPFHLKSAGRFYYFISITTPEFKSRYLNMQIQNKFYRTMWLSANFIFCLLFWLLAFQNPVEKNLRFIALTLTFVTLLIYFDSFGISPGGSYIAYRLSELSSLILVTVCGILVLSMILRIFNRKITKTFKILIWIIIVCGITKFYFDSISSRISILILIFQGFLLMLAYAYYLIVSWKTLRGAQWAVFIGYLVGISFGISLATAAFMKSHSTNVIQLLYSGMFLSFPLSLLIYVAMRFKETLKEVQLNAKQVVQLSEEKKEQALNQQRILQEEVSRQTIELRTSLKNLEATQSQLIQSEKMASLGQLTAGIAHEIQNPLNFVNNFSEVNSELIGEIKKELASGNVNEARSIVENIEMNMDKITHHGKRADAIVKGMLQHSKTDKGHKEPTDINALADEYLRLSYQGMKAKDKQFNPTLVKDFDPSIGKVDIISHDIGRVLLNLYNNAFYAISEKMKIQPDKYEPIISVSTKKAGDKIEIRVKDNGIGIPPNVVDKIFQPFFTTKPAGQGTGLGLSISYDIVKAQGGVIHVNSWDNDGAEFIVQLPIV